ncbi:sulfur carrier protein ThiS [Gorillibacterium sp. sgz5001074]|uniref:sulfur carrier protein ThiS n=1 Tax=Gorillibacterium sp. sgz5001074 TaxID=3446695 RepID=UPI003F673A6D
MKVVINGEARELPDHATVKDMMLQFKLENKILVVERNRTIVDRNAYGTTVLQDGDQIEIVHFVGGG